MLVLLIFCCVTFTLYIFQCATEYVYYLYNTRINSNIFLIDGGDDKNRTRDPLRARQML